MNPAMKCMKLDFMLLKPYAKSVLLVLLVPLMFPFFTGSLLEGLSFGVTVMAMTTAYTFSISEKKWDGAVLRLPARGQGKPGSGQISCRIRNRLPGAAFGNGAAERNSALGGKVPAVGRRAAFFPASGHAAIYHIRRGTAARIL